MSSILAYLAHLGSDFGIRSLLLLPLALILLDLVLALVAAIRSHTFDATFLPRFLQKQVVPTGSQIALGITAGLMLHWSLAQIAVANQALLLAFYIAQIDSIAQNLSWLTSGRYPLQSGYALIWQVLRALFPQETTHVPPTDPAATIPVAATLTDSASAYAA